MQPNEVRLLWAYAAELWGATFVVPADQRGREVKVQVWLDVLGDLDAGLLRRAMVSMDAHFAPSPGELREVALRLRDVESGRRGAPSADEALAALYDLVWRFGWPRPTEALTAAEEVHPALASVIRAITWQEVCEDENPGVFRGQFARLYDAALERIARERRVPAPALAAHVAPALEPQS